MDRVQEAAEQWTRPNAVPVRGGPVLGKTERGATDEHLVNLLCQRVYMITNAGQ